MDAIMIDNSWTKNSLLTRQLRILLKKMNIPFVLLMKMIA